MILKQYYFHNFFAIQKLKINFLLNHAGTDTEEI